MSASLVGSEMCIRDSSGAPRALLLGARGASRDASNLRPPGALCPRSGRSGHSEHLGRSMHLDNARL
eukprot:7329057-Alexandrium_andersonii.AAC.1